MKYKLEGDINFYDSLIKSLDNDSDSDDEDLLCKISGIPLEDKMVILECNHKFNYEALYKEINKQKFEFKTYDTYSLPIKEQLKMRELKVDYFIKCPYCRNIQFTILPYYEELGLKKIYGINSLENKKEYGTYGTKDYEVYYYGRKFKKGICSHTDTNYICNNNFVASVPNSENPQLFYCPYHFRAGLKKYNLKEKQKKIEEKNKLKEESLVARQKLFEEKNLLRASKGLPPLKCLPKLKQVIENVIKPGEPIGQYIPEVEANSSTNTNTNTNTNLICKMILKTGPNKGKECGCKKIVENNLCKRHLLIKNKQLNNK
jgi:hypothetical protein